MYQWHSVKRELSKGDSFTAQINMLFITVKIASTYFLPLACGINRPWITQLIGGVRITLTTAATQHLPSNYRSLMSFLASMNFPRNFSNLGRFQPFQKRSCSCVFFQGENSEWRCHPSALLSTALQAHEHLCSVTLLLCTILTRCINTLIFTLTNVCWCNRLQLQH